jgi:hypothetical protein
MLGDSYMLPPPFTSADPSKAAVNMAFLPCSLRNVSAASGAASGYQDEDASFIAGFSIDKEMAISQRLYSTSADAVGRVSGSTEYVPESEDEELDGEHMEEDTPSNQNAFKSHHRLNVSELYNAVFKTGDESLRTVQDDDPVNSIEGYCAAVAGVMQSRTDFAVLGISPL